MIDVLRELLDGLAFARAYGAIHRDIKPDIVLLETGHAVLADFGISKALCDSGHITSTGVTPGTPMYMSPERPGRHRKSCARVSRALHRPCARVAPILPTFSRT